MLIICHLVYNIQYVFSLISGLIWLLLQVCYFICLIVFYATPCINMFPSMYNFSPFLLLHLVFNGRLGRRWWQQTYRSFFHCMRHREHAHLSLSMMQTREKGPVCQLPPTFQKSPIVEKNQTYFNDSFCAHLLFFPINYYVLLINYM